MIVCYMFKPDHNGECLTCDEWYDAHPQPLDPVLQHALRYWREVFEALGPFCPAFGLFEELFLHLRHQR